MSRPDLWQRLFQRAEARYPTVKRAVSYFRDEYPRLRPSERERITNPLLEKIFMLSVDQRWQAMFGAQLPGILWDTVVKKRQTVLLDYRHVLDTEMRRFQMDWDFDYLNTWTKTRGRSPIPFGVVLDEFAQMTQKVESGENPLAQELDAFIQGYMRQHQIWLTIGLQSPLQLDEHLQQTVLSLGSYLFGQATTIDAARLLANAMFHRNPYRVKHYRKVYVHVPRHADLPVEPEFMPLPEQTELYAQRIMKLKQYQFLLRPARSEGERTTDVYPISIRTVDQDPVTGTLQFPPRELLIQLRRTLAAKSGIPVKTLIAEQEARLVQGASAVSRGQRARTPDPAQYLAKPPAPLPAEENPRSGAQPRRHRVRVA